MHPQQCETGVQQHLGPKVQPPVRFCLLFLSAAELWLLHWICWRHVKQTPAMLFWSECSSAQAENAAVLCNMSVQSALYLQQGKMSKPSGINRTEFTCIILVGSVYLCTNSLANCLLITQAFYHNQHVTPSFVSHTSTSGMCHIACCVGTSDAGVRGTLTRLVQT